MPAVSAFQAFVSCLCLGTTDPAATRAEVEGVLAEMSKAVLTADAKGFLAHVAQDEPCFATEWRHWAEQLKDYRPAEFSLSIAEGESKFEETKAEFPLVMSWTITTGPKASWGAGGERRSVKFPPVIFAKEDSDGAGPLPARWVFRGEDWTEIKGDGFVLRYIPGEAAERTAKEVLKAFPIARAHDDEGFGVHPPPQILKLFTSMDHLKATVYLNMPDHYLGGWSESGESIKFMIGYTSGVEQWTNAYAHEYGHVCTWSLGPEASKVPWWVQEGAAELAAQEYRPGYWPRLEGGMRKDAADGKLTPWDEISDYITTKPPLKMRAYTQGNHMLGYISQRWGRQGRNDWLRAQCQGATLDEATRRVMKMPFEQLDREWREGLAKPVGQAPVEGARAGDGKKGDNAGGPGTP